jgi:hypothetical protein
MPSDIIPEKNVIKSYFWSLPDGNTLWTELQGIVYGEKILEAVPAEGLFHFLSMCKESEITVCVISHKSEYPALGPKVNLRDAALNWLTANNFFDNHLIALPKSLVFFESTRNFKVMRICTEKCSVFIDDLPEVFEEAHFPADVQKILYSQEPCPVKDVIVCEDWKRIEVLIDQKNKNNK